MTGQIWFEALSEVRSANDSATRVLVKENDEHLPWLILRRNVYGWFVCEARGIYGLAAQGRLAAIPADEAD